MAARRVDPGSTPDPPSFRSTQSFDMTPARSEFLGPEMGYSCQDTESPSSQSPGALVIADDDLPS